MGYRCMDAVMESRNLPRHLKLLALVLARIGNDDDPSNIYPGIETLALATGLHQTSIHRQLKELKDLGVIEVIGRSPTTWRLLYDGKRLVIECATSKEKVEAVPIKEGVDACTPAS